MAHLTTRTSYNKLIKRINRFPQGAPESELLYKILGILFNEDEAELVSRLPIKPFSLKAAAGVWKKSEKDAKNILDDLASRGNIVDVETDGEPLYVLPPPMAGFFEFSLMRVRDDVDQKVLSELYYQYLNVEEDFVRELFTGSETQLGRVFVDEPVIEKESLHVLDYERASEVVNTASHIGVGVCYCRHKMQHVGKECSAPMDICLTFNSSAHSLIKHGVIRGIDKKEGIDLLQKAYDHNLVQFGENVRERVNFICNCCGCCCEALLAAQRFGHLNPVNTTGFIPEVHEDQCNGCGKCIEICPVEAMTLISANDPKHPKKKIARLDERFCLGCAICVRNCSKKALGLIKRKETVITPLNSVHRTVLMALEKGTLQELIFDKATTSHRALALVFGGILKLPPVKRALATKQVKSRYLENLITKLNI